MKNQTKRRGPSYPESLKVSLVKKWVDGNMTAVEIRDEYGIAPSVLSRWKDRMAKSELQSKLPGTREEILKVIKTLQADLLNAIVALDQVVKSESDKK